MDKQYWNNYYKEVKGVFYPTPFVKFCFENSINKNDKILEIGCGNGRDSIFLLEKECSVIGIDQSEAAIQTAKRYAESVNLEPTFEVLSVNKIEKFINENITVVYSRFVIHSISIEEQDLLFSDVYDLLGEKGKFLFEIRTIKDSLYGTGKKIGKNEFITDHYRRFIDTKELLKRILSTNFKIKYFIENNGLAIFNDEDPVVARFLLTKS